MGKSLSVFRTFEDGRRVAVGRVEETEGNVVFRYDEEYLSTFAETTGSLSPLTLPYAKDPYSTPRNYFLDFSRKAFPTATVSGSWIRLSKRPASREKPSRRSIVSPSSETAQRALCPTSPQDRRRRQKIAFPSRRSAPPPNTFSKRKRQNSFPNSSPAGAPEGRVRRRIFGSVMISRGLRLSRRKI